MEGIPAAAPCRALTRAVAPSPCTSSRMIHLLQPRWKLRFRVASQIWGCGELPRPREEDVR